VVACGYFRSAVEDVFHEQGGIQGGAGLVDQLLFFQEPLDTWLAIGLLQHLLFGNLELLVEFP